MQKFCTTCGSKLDEVTGKCPICDRELTKKESRKQKKEEKKEAKRVARKEKWKKLTFKQKIKKICLRLIVFLFVILLIICGTAVTLTYFNVIDIPIVSNWFEKTPEEEAANKIESAFDINNLEEINRLIFPNDYYDVDDNINLDFNTSEKVDAEDIGIFSHLFEKTSVSYVKQENSKFIYDVTSPNMKGVFDDVEHIKTEHELSNHIQEYANRAEITKFTVAVDFAEIDGEIVTNYNTEEFINAITGGLLDEYKTLYKRYFEDLKSGKVVNLK